MASLSAPSPTSQTLPLTLILSRCALGRRKRARARAGGRLCLCARFCAGGLSGLPATPRAHAPRASVCARLVGASATLRTATHTAPYGQQRLHGADGAASYDVGTDPRRAPAFGAICGEHLVALRGAGLKGAPAAAHPSCALAQPSLGCTQRAFDTETGALRARIRGSLRCPCTHARCGVQHDSAGAAVAAGAGQSAAPHRTAESVGAAAAQERRTTAPSGFAGLL